MLFWCTWKLLCIFLHFAARSCHVEIAIREELLADRSLERISLLSSISLSSTIQRVVREFL
jgi:hypothetical protein